MRRIFLILALLCVASGVACAQVSRATDGFIQKFSYASTLVRGLNPSLQEDDLGRTILALARTDDATIAEAFRLLDKNKSYQRTTVGDLLLILIYEIPNTAETSNQILKIQDVLHETSAGALAPAPPWPWKINDDGTWGLESFGTRTLQIDSLAERLNFFQKQWPRRKFATEPVYERVKQPRPL
ncbi:MAG TPA: hypothetical protein VGL56_13210 [Fimbriimonadaceae bacterium]|jgi:hypothetical protein